MGSLENWSSDEGAGPLERPFRSRKPHRQSSHRNMNRSVSILSNLSEISESFVFGTTRWYPDEPKMNHDYSSDLREPMSKTSDPDIDDDWSDMPSYNPRSSSKASGSDVERERLERRRSISKLETLKPLVGHLCHSLLFSLPLHPLFLIQMLHSPIC